MNLITLCCYAEGPFDQAPYTSPRASGMGGALSTVADGEYAPFFNPAGIGGLYMTGKTKSQVRQLHFPYLGVEANENAMNLEEDFKAHNALVDESAGARVWQSHGGKKQYARMSSVFDVVYRRLTVLQYSDTQVYAEPIVPVSEEDKNDLLLQYKSQSGTGVGLSVSDAEGNLHLGVFGSQNQRKVVIKEARYLDVSNIDDRNKLLSDEAQTYSATSTNVGTLWTFSQPLRPALSIVGKDLGDTHWKASGASEELTSENILLGFSISPALSTDTFLTCILEAQHLSDSALAVQRKLHAALELTWGGFATQGSILGLRSGYSQAGGSFGVTLNLGLLKVEAASQAVDVGTGNVRFVERRNVAVFSVNVLDE